MTVVFGQTPALTFTVKPTESLQEIKSKMFIFTIKCPVSQRVFDFINIISTAKLMRVILSMQHHEHDKLHASILQRKRWTTGVLVKLVQAVIPRTSRLTFPELYLTPVHHHWAVLWPKVALRWRAVCLVRGAILVNDRISMFATCWHNQMLDLSEAFHVKFILHAFCF